MGIRQSFIRFAILCLCGLLPLHSIKADELRIVASDWEPYVNSAVERNGVAAALVTTALRRAGYEVQLYIDDWPRSLEATQAGSFDGIVTLWFTPERDQSIAFSEAFMRNELRFMKLVERDVQANKREDLLGLRVGVVEDYAYVEKPYDTTGIEVVSSGDVVQNMDRLLAGEVDLVLGDSLVLLHAADMRRAAKRVMLLPSVLDSRDLHFGVSRQREDHAQLISDFNTAISTMREDGTYNDILGAYRISQP